MRRKTTEEFVVDAKKVHGDKYDYSRFVYETTHRVSDILCRDHGLFRQSPANHLRGQGCPTCYKNNRIKWTERLFIDEAVKIHGDGIYSYDSINYVDYKAKVKIFCNTHKEYFYKTPFAHIYKKQGCPKCGYDTYTIDAFLLDAKKTHGDKYDYSKVIIVNNSTDVEIVCEKEDGSGNIHGSFLVKPSTHIKRKRGCPKCAGKLIDTIEFINRSKEIHSDNPEKYDYSKSMYRGSRIKVCIICSEHGEFWQTPEKHMVGQRCPKCSSIYSNAELEVLDFINKNYNGLVINHYKLKSRIEIDIFIPELNIGFEYNGLYWHSEINKEKNYHLDKTKSSEKEGIKLYHIWEDDWESRRGVVKSKILYLLKSEKIVRIGARKCVLREVSYQETDYFLINNHMWGSDGVKSPSYGLYYNGELLALSSFRKINNNLPKSYQENTYEWSMLCFKKNHVVVGGASRLLKYFLRKYPNLDLITYFDISWGCGGMYDKLGFECVGIEPPDYTYIIIKDGIKQREHKSNYTKEKIIKKFPDKGFGESMSEHEMMLLLKNYRVYDCGIKTYKLNNHHR